jgi:hypothetical protein
MIFKKKVPEASYTLKKKKHLSKLKQRHKESKAIG